jgi:endonuclease YncB( thermonuclease family)
MKFNFNRVLLSAVLALLAASSHAGTITGRVVGVSDGDTLTMLDSAGTQHKIRLSGIDAPEKGQPFGQHCKQSLSDLAYGRTVSVEANKRDRYGRLIGKVLVDGEDANLEQIQRGCGWHYKRYMNEQSLDDRLTYNATEKTARAGRVGLWADPDPVAPWEWRQASRK